MVDLHRPGSKSDRDATSNRNASDGILGSLTWADLALLSVPGIWATTRIMLHNIAGIPHLERYLAWMGLVWIFSVGITLLLRRLGLARKPAVYTSFVVVISIVSFGPLARQLGAAVGFLGVLVFAVVAGWLAVRLDGTFVLDAVVVAGAVFLLTGPFLIGVEAVSEYGENTLDDLEPLAVSMSERPDIWLVVLDGYPGSFTLESDFGVEPDAQLGTRLRTQGFDVPVSAWSSYTTTRWSVPSMFQMGYPSTSWTDNAATLQGLYDTISGENSFLETLESNGYETTMVEAGWSGSSCGPRFDRCVAPPLYDDAANLMTFDSVLGDQPFATPGFGFARGSQATMSRLLDLADQGRPENSPSFVFAHLLAPHPPLFLDANCDVEVDEARKGLFYTYPGVSAEERDRAFLGQVQCVDSFVLDFVERVDPDDLVVFVADHGTGRRAQMATTPDQWSDEAIRERMNIFLAARLPGNCTLGDQVILPNLLRRSLSCYSGTQLPEVEPRMFLGHDTEVGRELVLSLLESDNP